MIRLLSLFLLAVVLQPADLGAQIRPLPLPGELAKIKEHAKSSDPVALYQLAVCHAEGIGVEVDFVEALSLAKKAAELGDIPAMVMLSDLYRGYKGIKQDRDLVYHWAKRAADTGDPVGVVALARCHQIGCGVPRDDNEMMRLLRKAAATGSSHALAYLAGAYLFGDISIQNLSEGIKLARQADGLNQRSGTVILAYAYYVGRGVPKDEELGRQMALKASRMGSAHADTLLGIQILTNPGYDPAPAIPYLNRGLKLEIPRAMWALGVAYAEGRGVPKSSSQALELWRRGAEKGDENAMHAYAYATYNGMGRLPDQALGFALYLTAASLGNETTQSEIQKLSDNFKRSGDFTKGALIARSIKSQLDAGISPVELGPDFHSSQFWESQGAPTPGPGPRTKSSGTGMIFDANGHCFTNHHVIKEARAIKVHIPTTRTTMSARLIAGDEANDVAIIKIEGWKPHDKAHPPPLANAAAARLGDRVFTIGFPLAGYLSQDPKYTSGDISAFTGLGDDRRLIQITTPIQPGNSGGPLVLEDGRVVGVIVSLIDRIPKHVDSRGLDAQNINFAVKIDYLRLLAAGSGVEIPEGHKAGPDVIEQVRLHTVQIITE